MIITKTEIRKAIRSGDELGKSIYDAAKMTPIIVDNIIDLGADIVGIPWSAVAGTTEFAATKVDETIETIV